MAQFIPYILMAVGKVVEIGGGMKQGDAKAEVYEMDAALQRQRADTLAGSYNQKEETQRRLARIQAGERRAAMGQSGLGLSGSNADIDAQSQIMAEMDALNIRYEGQLERHNALAAADIDIINAKAIKKASRYSAWGQLIGAGGQAWGMAGGAAGGGGGAAASSGGGGAVWA